MPRAELTKEIALARYELFTEAAEHLKGDITNDEYELDQIGYVYNKIIALAAYWLEKAGELPEEKDTNT